MQRQLENRQSCRQTLNQSSDPDRPNGTGRRWRPAGIGTAIAFVAFAFLVVGIIGGMAYPNVGESDSVTNGGDRATASNIQDRESKPPTDGPQDPQGLGEELTLEEFMQIKLLRSQDVMEGMATRDFTLIAEAARDLQRLTEASKWAAHNSPEYAGLTTEFQTAIGRLQRAAKEENLEAVALRFYDMSTRCIDCHEHLRTVDF